METTTRNEIKSIFGPRPPWSHKTDFGRLLVIGGSLKYSGSPALSALAAIRSGADLVTVMSPRRAADIVASFCPDLITEPLPGEYIGSFHLNKMVESSEWADAVVIGGGAGRNEETLKTINRFIGKLEKPCVIDADGLRAVSGHPELLKDKFILTPHENEFLSLGGEAPSRKVRERAAQAKKLASSLGCTLLLKGHVDVITDGKRVALNRTGNPYMTRGGTGDVLAGVCGALLAQGIPPFTAASCGAWINGRAGDLAKKGIGNGFLAYEMTFFIQKAIWG